MRLGFAVVCLLVSVGCGRWGFDRNGSRDQDGGPSSDSGPDATPVDPLAAAGDEFDDGVFPQSWAVLNADNLSATEAGGVVTLESSGGISFWVGSGQGPLFYQPIAGDFVVTATLAVSSISDPSKPPIKDNNLAGVLARDPESAVTGVENNLWIGFGTLVANTPGAEAKNHTDDASEVDAYPWEHMEGQVRICRFGDTFQMLTRNGGAWQKPAEYNRPDLPETLQVGFFIQGTNLADISADFERVELRTPTALADCTDD